LPSRDMPSASEVQPYVAMEITVINLITYVKYLLLSPVSKMRIFIKWLI